GARIRPRSHLPGGTCVPRMRFAMTLAGRMRRIVVGVVVIGMTAWAAGALYYSGPGGPTARVALAVSFVVASALAFAFVPRRGRTLAGFLVPVPVLVGWGLADPASHARAWPPRGPPTPLRH